MTHNADLLARRQAVVPRGVGQFAGPVTAATGSGATIVDADGRDLIDFAGGIGVMNVGHCDPHVVKAIQDQAAELIHACIHVATYEPYVALCEKLSSMFPHGEGSKVMLANSGAEAVENAIKIARQATGRGAVLCFTESFHGRTLLCATLTSKVGYKVGCGPFAPEVYRLPYPNRFRYGHGLDREAFAERELARLEQSFFNTVAPGDLAAIIIECVQGEGGFVSAPRTYIEGLRRICDEHGIVLIFDEVQSGFCRTGEWAAYQHYGVEPDLSTWAKSMGGGMPISAVIGKTKIMDKAAPGTLGGTYGGNPVACAAALATIEVMERDDLNERSRVIGDRIEKRFLELQKKCPTIAHARGVGAMRAMVFMDSGDPPRAATETVRAIITACYERGLLCIPAGTFGHILRVLCPLVITDEQLERGLTILEEEVLRFAGPAARSTSTPART